MHLGSLESTPKLELLSAAPRATLTHLLCSPKFPRTGGHFACACVHPLYDNSVGASNLMAGKSKTRVKLQSF